MTLAPLGDLSDPDVPPPVAADESGRPSRTFLVVTAPIVVEAPQRVLGMPAGTTGVVAAGEAFDAKDFLRSLSPAHLSLELL